MSLLAFTWTWKLFLNISTISILVDLNVGICWNRFVCAIEHFTPTRNFTQQQLTMWNKIRLCHGCLDLWSWRVFLYCMFSWYFTFLQGLDNTMITNKFNNMMFDNTSFWFQWPCKSFN
jgi:hypothetical protein